MEIIHEIQEHEGTEVIMMGHNLVLSTDVFQAW